MKARNVVLALLVVAPAFAAAGAGARETTTLTRKDIRQIPILERPNRPGHFYGNTVRRMNDRKVYGVASPAEPTVAQP